MPRKQLLLPLLTELLTAQPPEKFGAAFPADAESTARRTLQINRSPRTKGDRRLGPHRRERNNRRTHLAPRTPNWANRSSTKQISPGAYNIDLKFAPDGDTASTRPSIFTAIQEQLGLKLESQKVPFETLVIDHCDHIPTKTNFGLYFAGFSSLREPSLNPHRQAVHSKRIVRHAPGLSNSGSWLSEPSSNTNL
jgi:hypothetical protein